MPDTQLNLGADWDVPAVPGLTLNARALHGRPGRRPQRDAARATDKSYWASAGGFPGAGYLVLGSPRTLVASGSVDF